MKHYITMPGFDPDAHMLLRPIEMAGRDFFRESAPSDINILMLQAGQDIRQREAIGDVKMDHLYPFDGGSVLLHKSFPYTNTLHVIGAIYAHAREHERTEKLARSLQKIGVQIAHEFPEIDQVLFSTFEQQKLSDGSVRHPAGRFFDGVWLNGQQIKLESLSASSLRLCMEQGRLTVPERGWVPPPPRPYRVAQPQAKGFLAQPAS